MNKESIVLTCKKSQSLEEFLIEMSISRNMFIKLYHQKLVQINQVPSGRNAKVNGGDRVEIFIEDEENHYKPINLNLSIVYEDEDLLLVDKPPFLNVLSKNNEPSLANGISYLFRQRNLIRKIRFVTRLDRDTTGLIIIAKNPIIQNYMQSLMERNQLRKLYYAIVRGQISTCGTINTPIEKEEGGIRYRASSQGKKAITKYRIIKEKLGYKLLEVELITGRTHQIRCHLSSIGCPIVGDILYGGESGRINRQALHCHRMDFISLRRSDRIIVQSDLPDDMKKLI